MLRFTTSFFFQAAAKKHVSSFSLALRQFGPFGLFAVAIVDSLPLPTFNGPDILIAILVAAHHEIWYECAAATTAGSLLGAFITFQLARRAGLAYLHKSFGKHRVPGIMRLFTRWETMALVVCTAVPIPLPTSFMFAAAGAANYNPRKYLLVVGLSRAVRYSVIAILADLYGRRFIHVFQHPERYWGWLLLVAAIIASAIATRIMVNRHLEKVSGAENISAP